jgi:hypothetical protein
MECNTPLGSDEKAVGDYRTCWATVKASLTFLTAFHHLWLPPAFFRTWDVSEESDEPVEASHARDVADVVSSIIAQSTSDGE